MNDLQTQLQAAKARLNAAAAACLSGAPGAEQEADEAMAEVEDFSGKYARASEEMAERATAKAAFTVAAQATLRGDPEAERMARNALVELDAASADLSRLQNAPPAA